MAPAQQGQRRHRDNVKEAYASTMAMTPLWWGQQYHLDNGNNAIATRATKLLQWWQRCLDCEDACASTMATPLQWERGCQLGNIKVACASMMVTTPLLQGQQHQLNDYASLTTAEMPLHWGGQRPLQWQQSACTSMATTPSQRGQQCHHDDGEDACASMMTKTPLQQGQQCQLEDGNNTIATRETTPLQIKGNNVIVTRATMPAQRKQGRLPLKTPKKIKTKFIVLSNVY
jgi:hypothetical protein